MKGYMSAREAAYKWGVSESRVHKLCQAGRIPGVERFGRSWAIPSDADKPVDPRRLPKTETRGLQEETEGPHL